MKSYLGRKSGTRSLPDEQ